MKRVRRVRFAETEADRPDAGGNFNSHTLKKQDTPVEKFEANNPIGELSSTHNPVKSDVLRRSLMPVAMVTPIKVRSPLLSRSSKSSPRESRNSDYFHAIGY
ncbi:hypothetical protein MKW94_028150 [Papaver nudicaule]|uniref:Uncharacterized protein n=1 Tax=Papaver nudicaule TaxID=74823 RepID=A0AA41S3Z0_PAPNU|nr:hypothetical protein [Papaver nudicaule]